MMKDLPIYAEQPPHPPFGHLLPAGEKRSFHLPLEGGGRRSAAGGGDHRERHSQLRMPQLTPPRHCVPTLPLKGRLVSARRLQRPCCCSTAVRLNCVDWLPGADSARVRAFPSRTAIRMKWCNRRI